MIESHLPKTSVVVLLAIFRLPLPDTGALKKGGRHATQLMPSNPNFDQLKHHTKDLRTMLFPSE
jgi:hypothetical protein